MIVEVVSFFFSLQKFIRAAYTVSLLYEGGGMLYEDDEWIVEDTAEFLLVCEDTSFFRCSFFCREYQTLKYLTKLIQFDIIGGK